MERVQQVDAGRPSRARRTVRTHEMPGCEPLVLGERVEQGLRRPVLEREERDPLAPIGARDDTRRESAEPSAAVVEENRPDQLLGHSGPFCPAPRLDRVTTFIEHHQSWALVLLFLLIGVESAGVPLPGETALVASGVLASQEKLDIVAVIAVAAAAAIIGDNIGYLLGRHGGRKLLERWGPISRHAQKVLPRSERLFARHGGKTVFFGRFIAVLRITAAWMAGVSHMPWWRFLVFNAAGGIIWATLVGLVAFYLGDAAASAIQTYGLYAAGAIALATVAVLVILRLWERRMLGEE